MQYKEHWRGVAVCETLRSPLSSEMTGGFFAEVFSTMFFHVCHDNGAAAAAANKSMSPQTDLLNTVPL